MNDELEEKDKYLKEFKKLLKNIEKTCIDTLNEEKFIRLKKVLKETNRLYREIEEELKMKDNKINE